MSPSPLVPRGRLALTFSGAALRTVTVGLTSQAPDTPPAAEPEVTPR